MQLLQYGCTFQKGQVAWKKAVDPSFSLRQFAVKVGISATFLSKVETGEFDPPSAENIIKMAELLDVDADVLPARSPPQGEFEFERDVSPGDWPDMDPSPTRELRRRRDV